MQISTCFVTEIDHDGLMAGALVNDLKMLRCLKKFGEVDVIYLQNKRYRSVWLAFLPFLTQILRSFSKPYCLYFSRGLFSSFVLVFFRPFHRKKIVHEALSVPLPSTELKYAPYNRFESFALYCVTRFLEEIVSRNVDAITVAAEDYRAELQEVGVVRDRIWVLPFYVEDAFFRPPLKNHVNGTFVLCYAGGFHLYHDLSYLIKAFELVSRSNEKIQLLLIGDGALHRDIEKEVDNKKLAEKAKFTGRIPHSSMPSLLSKVDVFILLMRKSGISTSLLEAAAAGKAIITSRKSDTAFSRYFRHRKEIYFTNSTSPIEVAEAINLLYNDSALRNTLGKEAREVAKRNFSEKAAVKHLEQLMNKVCMN